MSKREDLLLEIQTEELPPRVLTTLGAALKQEMEKSLQKAQLSFGEGQFYVTPRRLALLIKDISVAQATQKLERKGPALQAAFDQAGKPTPACLGFARSLGVDPKALTRLKNQEGEWVAYTSQQPGKPTLALLPAMVEQALASLPIPKRMRWGDNSYSFIRPVHSVILLFGKKIVETELFGKHSNRMTAGHRFHHPALIKITLPRSYAETLEKKGKVIADFDKRKTFIKEKTQTLVKRSLKAGASILFQEDLLNEVTGLVEWPVAICGGFDPHFLNLPPEVLISTLQDHQRYFPIADREGKLLPNFVAVINIDSRDLSRVVKGNERVLAARLSDAAFFYEQDKKQTVEQAVEGLKGIVFQAKLGTLYDKTERMIKLANYLAPLFKENPSLASRAAFLAKADLTTGMVGEFPELQGVMGFYYAIYGGEDETVAQAIREHYQPRFAMDSLPKTKLGSLLALADRVDSLIGIFGINQSPSGDKDPYGLRRAALGLVRILIENQLDLDLQSFLTYAAECYGQLENKETVSQVLRFILDRMKGLYQEKEADAFAAVMAVRATSPYDIHLRIAGIQAFKNLAQAESLIVANKRVSKILAQYTEAIQAKTIDPHLFQDQAEKELFQALQKQSAYQGEKSLNAYTQGLLQLAELREPIDKFFDQVMVMVEDKKLRENRLLLLLQLRALFLQIADLACLVQ